MRLTNSHINCTAGTAERQEREESQDEDFRSVDACGTPRLLPWCAQPLEVIYSICTVVFSAFIGKGEQHDVDKVLQLIPMLRDASCLSRAKPSCTSSF